jgi:hypothetical protein
MISRILLCILFSMCCISCQKKAEDSDTKPLPAEQKNSPVTASESVLYPPGRTPKEVRAILEQSVKTYDIALREPLQGQPVSAVLASLNAVVKPYGLSFDLGVPLWSEKKSLFSPKKEPVGLWPAVSALMDQLDTGVKSVYPTADTTELCLSGSAHLAERKDYGLFMVGRLNMEAVKAPPRVDGIDIIGGEQARATQVVVAYVPGLVKLWETPEFRWLYTDGRDGPWQKPASVGGQKDGLFTQDCAAPADATGMEFKLPMEVSTETFTLTLLAKKGATATKGDFTVTVTKVVRQGDEMEVQYHCVWPMNLTAEATKQYNALMSAAPPDPRDQKRYWSWVARQHRKCFSFAESIKLHRYRMHRVKGSLAGVKESIPSSGSSVTNGMKEIRGSVTFKSSVDTLRITLSKTCFLEVTDSIVFPTRSDSSGKQAVMRVVPTEKSIRY